MTHQSHLLQHSAPDPLLLDLPTAGRLLGVSKWTLYELIQSGDLPSVKLHSRRLIPRVDLEDFVQRLQGRKADR